MTVFIKEGDPYLTTRQAEDRGRQIFESEMAAWQREAAQILDPEGYKAWASKWIQSNVQNSKNNAFNKKLHDYRVALTRLAKYRVADGRPELTEERPTGVLDDEGQEITEAVVVQAAIEPLPAEVEQTIYDESTLEQSVIMVTNPAITEDKSQRAEAQAVVDGAGQKVLDFPASSLE